MSENKLLLRSLFLKFLDGQPQYEVVHTTGTTTSGKPIKKIPIRPIENRFSIKSLTNDIRLGLKNYFSKDEDVVIYNYDLLITPNILLWIEDGSENGVIESLRLHSVKLLLDTSIVFEIEDGDRVLDGEFTIDKISTDELADIANAIQETYNDIVTRK